MRFPVLRQVAPPRHLPRPCLPLILVSVVYASLTTSAWAQTQKLSLGLSSSSYLGQGSSGRADNYSALGAELELETDGKEVAAHVNAIGLIGFNHSDYRFIEAPEAWFGTSKNRMGPVQFSVGRRLEEWSKLDSQWGLGLWQPRFRWDYLRPENVGLLGLHASLKTKYVQAWAMASPIFVPDRGAPLDFSNGRMHSLSPWSLNPPYTVKVFDKTTEIRYDAKIPRVSDVISQPHASARVRLGRESGSWMSASYAYKPMNQLLMSYDAQHVTTVTQRYIEATIYPRVTYHHIAAVDAGYTASNFETWLSWLGDRPEDTPGSGPLRTTQMVSQAMLLSPSFSYWFAGRAHADSGGKATATYLRKFGDDPADAGKYADGSSSFDSRYPYQDAIIVSARSPEWQRMTADLRVLYDLDNPGTIVSWLVEYSPTEQWSLHLATDMLTSWTEEGSDDFIHRYRANDRITGGVTYVF